MADLEKGKPSTPPSPKSAQSPTLKEKHIDEDSNAPPAVPLTAPVSFGSLFRFATVGELTLNAIGIVAAVAAGTAQPLMTLLFGNLITAFVDFGRALRLIAAGDAAGGPALEAAQASFKAEAAKDATYLVVIGIGMWICTYAYMVIWVYTGEVNSKRVRERYLQAILRQDIAYFDKVGSGEVATRISSDTHLVQQGISEKVAIVVQFVATFLTGFILAYSRSWRLALALTSIFPCIGIAGGVMNKFMTKFMQLKLQQVAEGGTIAEEVLSTIRTAHAFGTQGKLANQYSANSEATLAIMYRSAAVHGCGLGVFFFVIYGAYALAFYYGTSLILWGLADAGIVVNVFMAILIGSFSIAMLTPELQAINNAKAAAAKLFETIDRIPDIDSANPDGEKPAHIDGRITLHDVTFSYPARKEVTVLKGVTMSFEAGKTAALVGASGSGKSTIVSLVERFYDPLGGVVRLDGVDVKNLNLKWLRAQIGLVSQEPVLFATTIRGNVAHGLIGSQWENATEEEKFERVKQACVQSNADGFIGNLPNGYDTLVGDRGFLLSGGQKQRIAIARAIVGDPKILLLDEATSALDTQSEGVVQNALEKAQKGRTTITIAHRLSTIKDADQIFVMGDGQILEQGTHQQLLANREGPYARLVQTQQLKERQPRAADTEEEDIETNTPTDEELAKQQEQKEIEENAKTEAPLGRTGTSRSLASEILAKRAEERGDEGEREYSLFYLFKRMGRINSSQWPYYLVATFAALITGMVFPMFALIYGKAIDGFSLPNPADVRSAGDHNALWFFLIAVVAAAAIIVQNAFFSRSASFLTSRLRDLSFRALLRQDIEYFDDEKHTAGSLAADLSGNPQKIEGLAGVTLGAIVQSSVTLIGGIIVGLTAGPKLAAVGVACIPLVVSAGYIRLRVVVLKDQANKSAHAASSQLAAEAAGSIRTVASLTREDDCLRIYSQSLEEPLRKSNRSSFFSNGFYATSQSMVFWVIALVFWYGSLLVASQEYDTNKFFVVLMATVFGASQAGNIFNFVPDISSAKGAAEDVINLLDSKPEIDAESEKGKQITSTKGSIRMEDVHFRYPTRPGVRVLRGFNITIEPGTFVALVGASGCGKSTIIQLIERFYDPTAGRVFLDDQLISDLNVQSYRRQISLVSQEPSLYAGTIRFNILLGATKPAEQVTEEEIIAACRDANILDFIQSLPDGFETQVGGKGTQLSGGQKQRIAIARALIRNPKILLLDEATSALDSNSERVVQDALDRAAKGPGRTTVAIAHRLSTIQNADCIYFVKEGRVSEKGTHDELLALKGGYYEYVLLQTLSGQGH